MKIYLDKPIPKACGQCPLARKVENGPWYVCFITGRTHTSITTTRPEDCPIDDESCEVDGDDRDCAELRSQNNK